MLWSPVTNSILLVVFRDLQGKKDNLNVHSHGELTRQLGKLVQYEINDLCLCRPGFCVPGFSDSSLYSVHTFVVLYTHLFKLYTYRQPAD